MHLLVYFGTLILCLKILDVFMRMCLHSYHAAYGWFSALSPSRRVAVSVLITFCFTPLPTPTFSPHCVLWVLSWQVVKNCRLTSVFLCDRAALWRGESCSVHQQEPCSEWDADICSWLQLTTCFCLLIPSDVIKLANEYHLWWFYRRSGHILRGCLGNTKNKGSCE